MKVFVLSQWIAYESDEILGVFATLGLAQEAGAAHPDAPMDLIWRISPTSDTVWRGSPEDDPLERFSRTGYSIEQFEVLEGKYLSAEEATAFLVVSRELLESLASSEGCDFDHHGGCQAHLYLDLDGEKCPQQLLKEHLGYPKGR